MKKRRKSNEGIVIKTNMLALICLSVQHLWRDVDAIQMFNSYQWSRIITSFVFIV